MRKTIVDTDADVWEKGDFWLASCTVVLKIIMIIIRIKIIIIIVQTVV